VGSGVSPKDVVSDERRGGVEVGEKTGARGRRVRKRLTSRPLCFYFSTYPSQI
jgi:hypothetical protein